MNTPCSIGLEALDRIEWDKDTRELFKARAEPAVHSGSTAAGRRAIPKRLLVTYQPSPHDDLRPRCKDKTFRKF